MIDTVDCDQTTADLWKYNIDLEVSKVSDLFAIKHYGPKSVFAFKAEEMYEQWLRVVAEGSDALSKPKKAQLGGAAA